MCSIVDAHARLSSDCPRGRVAAALSEFHDRLLQPHPSRRPSPLSRRLRPSSADRRMLSSTSPPLRVICTSRGSRLLRLAYSSAAFSLPNLPACSISHAIVSSPSFSSEENTSEHQLLIR